MEAEAVVAAKYIGAMLASSSPHLSVLDELTDNLGVVWGLLVAFASSSC